VEAESARALNNDARIIVMDEPTTALTRKEVMRLFSIVETLKCGGASFIFVSHKIEEVLDGCDTITVLRDGRVAAQGAAAEFGRERLIEDMTGRRIENKRHEKSRGPPLVRYWGPAGSSISQPRSTISPTAICCC
jgi:simple sugar transport system ATP-binding protein